MTFNYAVFVGALPALILRRRHDANSDGRLSPAELKNLTRDVETAVQKDVSLSLDGQTLRFAPGRLQLVQGARPQLGPVPLLFTGTWNWPLGPDRHSVRYADRLLLGPVGERHVRVASTPQVRLLESHAGSWDRGLQRMFTFLGPPSGIEDRSIAILFQAAGSQKADPSHEKLERRGAAALIAALGLLGGLMALVVTFLVHRTSDRRKDEE